ncbi:Glutamate decarboxylase 2 [Coemansia sp. Benny D115]|nr:Glutamate decarboxylase 2 [Coemansia sp. Benny D115]
MAPPDNHRSQIPETPTLPAQSATADGRVEELRTLLQRAANEFPAYALGALDLETPVIQQQTGEQIIAQSNLDIPDKGTGHPGIWDDIHTVFEHSANTWSNRFLYKLYAAPTPAGVLGESLMGLLNNNSHVFNSSPIGAVLETVCSRELARLANFPAETAAGLTLPGGSYSNIHALIVARNQKFPEIKTRGLAAMLGDRATQPLVFTSAHAHYSIEKAAMAAGIGLQNVIHVPTDNHGRMDPQALRLLVEKHKRLGASPFFVNATAGTTVLGAFDPLEEIAAVCRDHGLWLHVDGSWGGPLALFGECPDFQYSLPAGAVNSFTINPHKLLGVPMHCSFLLMRDGLGVMRDALGLGADYLYHTMAEEAEEGVASRTHHAGSTDVSGVSAQRQLGGSWDFGDATLGCGRRPDAIKMWLVWRYHGSHYFRDRVTRARTLALTLDQRIRFRIASAAGAGSWKIYSGSHCTNVCFWYVPQGAQKNREPLLNDADFFTAEWLGDVTKTLCNYVNTSGKLLIDYATVDRFVPTDTDAPGEYERSYRVPYFFRIPFNNPSVTEETLDLILDAIEQAALQLLANSNSNGNGNIGGSSQNTNPAVSSTSSSTSAKETSNTSTKSQTTSASAPAETTSKSTAGSAVAGTTGTYSQEPSDFAYTCKSEFVDFSKSDAMSKFSFVWCPQNAYQTDNSVVWRLTPECGTTMVYPWDFHYGKIEARIRIGPGSGVVTAMILMGPPPADEIDFEWVGKDLTHVQTMYYVQSHRIDNIPRVYGVDQQGQGDLSTTFQNYAIELKEDTVTWFLNGEALPFVLKRDSRGFPTYANRARLGIWDGTQTSGWAGTVDWSQGPFTAEMMWFNFTPYC